MKYLKRIIIILFCLLLSGCSPSAPPMNPEVDAALSSLQKLDSQPAYTLDYTLDYRLDDALRTGIPGYGAITSHFNSLLKDSPIQATGFTRVGKACTGFSATGANGDKYFSHNEDWVKSNYVVVTTHPPKGYPSISVCGVGYPDGDKEELLATPFYPLSGMNSKGLTVSTYSVPTCQPPNDPEKEALLWPVALRLLLDRAATVEEAIALLDDYNIIIEEGNGMQFFIGEASGNSAIVAWIDGKAVPVWKEGPWQAVTNFVQTDATPDHFICCNRYYTASKTLNKTGSSTTPESAMKLLQATLQGWAGGGTQFSVVFNQTQGNMYLSFGRRYEKVYSFNLQPD